MINIRIKNVENQDIDYFQNVFEDKKTKITNLNIEFEKLNHTMVNNHVKQDRLEKIKAFITDYKHLTHDVLESIFTKIITVTDEEVIFCISKENYTNERFIEAIENLKKYEPLF